MRAAAAALFLVLLPASAGAGAQAFDPMRSRIEFDLRTRWGQPVRGHFPRFEGAIDTLPDGRRQVRMRLSAADVVVSGSERYTRLARGPQLFDAARHPWIEFVSVPAPAGIAASGGTLDGELRLRGVQRRERFVLAPATCARPGHDCPVIASGKVSRDDYGLDGWQWALADRVRFRLHVHYAD